MASARDVDAAGRARGATSSTDSATCRWLQVQRRLLVARRCAGRGRPWSTRRSTGSRRGRARAETRALVHRRPPRESDGPRSAARAAPDRRGVLQRAAQQAGALAPGARRRRSRRRRGRPARRASASCSPAWPAEMAARKPTRHDAPRPPRARAAPRAPARCRPPARCWASRARRSSRRRPRRAVPVARSSLCSWPGVRRCTCGSTKAGSSVLPVGLDHLDAVAGRRGRRRARRCAPSRTSTSSRASMPSPGSTTRAPRTSRSAAGRGALR